MRKIDDILNGYASGKQDTFKFFGFISPPETEEQYRWAKECGYTHLNLFHYWDRARETENARIQNAVELAGRNGLKIVWMGHDFVKYEQPFANSDAFDGIYADEPLSIGDLEELSSELTAFQENYPDKNFYVNLVAMRGRSMDVYTKYFGEHFLKKALKRTVSSDLYPLREPDENGKTMDSFLDCIRRIGKLAIETDSEMYFFVQTIGIHGRGWAHPARRPSTEDIRFLQYVILSCGARGFQHFCYMSPGRPPYSGEFTEQDYSCIDPDGNRTEIWYSAQKVIAEFKKFENIALKFHWKGIMPVYGTQATERSNNFDELGEFVASHSYIKSISAQQDLLVGCFEDDDGNVGLTLVNFSDPYKKLSNSVSVQFNTAEPIAVIKDGDVSTIGLENGIYNAVLHPGEGQFLILPKGEVANLQIVCKEEVTPEYLREPPKWDWKETFSNEVGNFIDTYNIYGSGNSHFEYIKTGYPVGGSGRVARLFTTTQKDKDWSSYKFYLPDISYDENKRLVFKMYFDISAFRVDVSCDNMITQCNKLYIDTMERYGEWTWLSIPLKDIWYDGLTVLKEITMCIGNGIPYGTSAYLDEILLCDIDTNKQEE